MKTNHTDKRTTKLRDVRGISRAVAIMLILVAVMLVIVSIPLGVYVRDKWREIECMTSLDSARRQMVDKFLLEAGELEMEEAKSHVGYVMNGWDDLCPGGGIVYIVKDDDPNAEIPYKLVCGLHGEDAKERTRLNANYVYKRVIESVEDARIRKAPIPETVTIRMNGEDVVARLVTEDQKIRRSTAYYDFDDDVVAFYGIAGNGTFTDTGVKDGGVCYFAYADKEYCALRYSQSVWTGDSWDGK